MPICVQEQDSRGLGVPRGRRRRRDQPRVRPAHRAARRRRALFRARALLREGCLRGARDRGSLTGDAAPAGSARRADPRRGVRRARCAAQRAVASPRGKTARAHLTAADVAAAAVLRARAPSQTSTSRELWPCFDLRSLYRLSWGGGKRKGESVREARARRVRAATADATKRCAERDDVCCSRASSTAISRLPAAATTSIVYDPQDPAAKSHASLSRARPAASICAWRTTCANRADRRRARTSSPCRSSPSDRAVRSGPTRCKPRATIANRTSCTAFRSSRRRRWRSRRTAASARELGLADDRGKRYSWGYGACPDISQHEIVLRLLDAEAAIGDTLTEAFQIVPEQSTAAIVMHHPQGVVFQRRCRARDGAGLVRFGHASQPRALPKGVRDRQDGGARNASAIGLVTKTLKLPFEMISAWRRCVSIMLPRISPGRTTAPRSQDVHDVAERAETQREPHVEDIRARGEAAGDAQHEDAGREHRPRQHRAARPEAVVQHAEHPQHGRRDQRPRRVRRRRRVLA